MATSNNNNNNNNNNRNPSDEDVDETIPLPGFRFHPTDDELVGFYLRRKIEKKPISLELIKAIDIYKYEPWDLPKATSNTGDKEWYFFCKRGRKYKNSIRPNRVTGSGFWKATGIDKPVYDPHGGHRCIGLKKTLVYYRGSAGKGTKTDWMMHEFRLPSNTDRHSAKASDPQEAEIWTLCRIFKRNMSYRKYTPDWRELSAKRQPVDTFLTSKKCNNNTNKNINDQYSTNNIGSESYIDFTAPISVYHDLEKKPLINVNHHHHINNNAANGTANNNNNHVHVGQVLSSSMTAAAQFHHHHPGSINSLSSFSNSFQDIMENEFLTYTDWDELRSVVDQFVVGPRLL